jgi:hypothetical protein
MVDTYGRWTVEKDYSTFPKEKWCDLDYVANWIREHGYTPKIDLEELIEYMIYKFEEEIETTGDYGPAYGENIMIHMENFATYIDECGGIEEFDFEA